MNTITKRQRGNPRAAALQALRAAVVAGQTHDYELLVHAAHRAGVTDDEIDLVAEQAMRDLLNGAEEPVTARQLTIAWAGMLDER